MALTLRTDDELEQALSDLAESQGLSRQEVIRRAVLEMHGRTAHRSRVSEASRRMREQYAEALERLGSV
jgi:predicted transcriptional regulator